MIVIISAHNISNELRGALRRYATEVDVSMYVSNCKKIVIMKIISMIKRNIDRGKAVVVYYPRTNSHPVIEYINFDGITVDDSCGIPVIWDKT